MSEMTSEGSLWGESIVDVLAIIVAEPPPEELAISTVERPRKHSPACCVGADGDPSFEEPLAVNRQEQVGAELVPKLRTGLQPKRSKLLTGSYSPAIAV